MPSNGNEGKSGYKQPCCRHPGVLLCQCCSPQDTFGSHHKCQCSSCKKDSPSGRVCWESSQTEANPPQKERADRRTHGAATDCSGLQSRWPKHKLTPPHAEHKWLEDSHQKPAVWNPSLHRRLIRRNKQGNVSSAVYAIIPSGLVITARNQAVKDRSA